MDKEKLLKIIENFLNRDFNTMEEFEEVAKEMPLDETIRTPYTENSITVRRIVRKAREYWAHKISFTGKFNDRGNLLEFKKPKSTQDVIHDLKILHSNLNGHYQTELLTNTIEFLENKEESRQLKEQALHRAFRQGGKTLKFGPSEPLETPPPGLLDI